MVIKMNKEKNKFLSYLHMAAAVFRVYASKSNVLETKEFINGIIERISKYEIEVKELMQIGKEGNNLNVMQKMAVCMCKIKTCSKDDFSLCIEVLKTIDMGVYQVMNFIKENKNYLDKEFILCSKNVLEEYNKIAKEMKAYINHQKL